MARLLVLLLAALVLAAAPSVAGAHPEPGDVDGDTIKDERDNCLHDRNADQADTDGDGRGDACDDDDDADGVPDATDNCRTVANPGQESTKVAGRGDACVVDTDGDGRFDDQDNCPRAPNPDQRDLDDDDLGDVCDNDDDNDKNLDSYDNCPTVVNTDLADSDGDGVGDACDTTSPPAGGGAPTPAPGGPGAPAAPAADTVAPTVVLGAIRAHHVREDGRVLAVPVRCSEACRLQVTARATGAAARRARLGSRGLTVARGAWRVDAAGRTYVFARLSAGARRLRAGRRLTARLTVVATDAAGNRRTVTRTVVLRG